MRRVITILGIPDRAKLHTWVDAAPVGYRVEFKEPSRSLAQNDLRPWPFHRRARWRGAGLLRYARALRLDGIQRR
jgi:hypothetical protein